MLNSTSNWVRALFLALLLAAAPAHAQDPESNAEPPASQTDAQREADPPESQPDAASNAELLASQPNGCGSGWTIYLVPDSIPVANCVFRAACDEHDGCYGKCEGRVKDASAPQCEYLRCRKGGDLHSSARCNTDARLKQLESDAQTRRRKCDVAIAAKIRQINSGKPVCQAFSYAYEYAVKRFGDPFFKGIRPSANALDQEEYEHAIREFFLHGTDAEFETFNANPPDFSKALKYEPGQGLVNVPTQ
jgi:hypothetical protein